MTSSPAANGLGGRTLLVVGGGSGIGLAAARLAADRGAKVTVADVDSAAAERAEQLGAGFVECDATDAASAEAAVRSMAEHGGRLDCLFTTVGGAHLAGLDELDPESWSREIDFNLGSAYNVCRAALPLLKEQRSGAVVTTSSGFAAMPGIDRAGYTAAKAGVIAFTRSLAATLAPFRARANCIAPGPTDTPRFRAMNGGDAGVEEVRKSMPLGEIPTPEDCANVALFLLSDAARQVTGQVIHVNGGLLMP
jgi:NAD(P)-dependent dehydrogenase (short-subunit alcohol dehydrogenase family)